LKQVTAPPDTAPQGEKDAFENFKTLLDQIAASSQPQPNAFVSQYFESLLTQPQRDNIFGAEDVAVRRTNFVTAILPLIHDRLSRRLVVETLIARLGGDTGLTESLLTDAALLADPSQSASPGKPLLDTFKTAGVTASFYTQADLSGTPAKIS